MKCRICSKKTDDEELCDECWHYRQGEEEENEMSSL